MSNSLLILARFMIAPCSGSAPIISKNNLFIKELTLLSSSVVILLYEPSSAEITSCVTRSVERIDATHIISHVNRISTTDLLFRSVKCLLEEINNTDKDYFQEHIPELLRERYLNKFSSFRMSKDKKMDKLAEIVEDGYLIKSLLEKPERQKLKE